jgi:hypothetical protein
MISRLGLLQASDPSTPPLSSQLSYTNVQQALWSPQDRHIRFRAAPEQPIWTHAALRVSDFPARTTSTLPADMLPHAIHLWPEDPTLPFKISILQIPDEHGAASIIGLGETGTKGPVPAQLGEGWRANRPHETFNWGGKKRWEDGDMAHFEVDAPGGECVVEVHVSQDRSAFRLVTNRRREGVFGDGKGKEWDVQRAGEGEEIVGLSLCYGRPGGWSDGMKMWSHWGLSDLAVVVANVEAVA